MLRLKNISKFYYSKGIIASGLSRVNLELNPGEFVVITGESGSGKSTLINVLSGLDTYEEGEMYVDGKETSHYTTKDFEDYRRKYIANIFQNFNLVSSYTVYQNIELALLVEGKKKNQIKSEIDEIIRQVGLSQYRNTKVSKLSGGQKQRVTIARALAKNTPIIVADEPTGSLDSKSAKGIVDLLRDVAKEHLVIVVTHNYDQFEECATRRIKLSDGRIIEDEMITPFDSSIEIKPVETSSMGWMTKFLLGIRNTFNLIPKFLLLLLVFLFLTTSVLMEYSSFKATDDSLSSWGFNDFFPNDDNRRIIVKHPDNTPMSEADWEKLAKTPHFSTLFKEDILLDNQITVDCGNQGFDVLPSHESKIPKLNIGRKPQADDEVVLGINSYEIKKEDAKKEVLGKEAFIRNIIGSSTGKGSQNDGIRIKVTGIYYVDQMEKNGVAITLGGRLHASKAIMKQLTNKAMDYHSTTNIEINGQKVDLSFSEYILQPLNGVGQGHVIVPEDADNFYENGSSRYKTLPIRTKNIYFEDGVDVVSVNTYNKQNYKKLLGTEQAFDDISNTFYISPEDYSKLFDRDSYQSSVYVKDRIYVEEASKWLKKQGYKIIALDVAKKPFVDTAILNIVQVPFNLGVVIGIFFICYFVIRLILRSRSTYFSTLRLLSLDMKSIKQILDVELILIINIAYLMLVGVLQAVKADLVKVDFVKSILPYLHIQDYMILYAIVVFLAYIISRKFSKRLFRSSAMSTYREEV